MKIYNKFDAIKVPFPFTDKESLKRRPALVISASDYQSKYNHCILAMITSAKQSSWEDDVIITNLTTAGLRSDSKIRLKIFSLDSDLIIEKLGNLSSDDQKVIYNKLQKYI